ncbi:MAG: hypothetical protein COY68_02345 [Candidatus Levybacteria bacterium CG_4_10_14_0_8_um_filter_35_23]|nr:MAG: hypothetical protein COY68_02345 [Candidatus Levybacteria bacterium CG_4_10_14_0_8_um_filter_35_23]
MFKTIYVSMDIYADLKTQNPKPFSVAILRHQEVHAKNVSLFKTLKFILSKDFRVKEETLAYTAMFKHLKQHNQTFDLDHLARDFSKLRYIWMTSYAEGKKLITKIWEEA